MIPAVRHILKNKVLIGNSLFSIFGFQETLELMKAEITDKQHKYYTAITNIHVMVLVDRDTELAHIINNADISFCDSVSIVNLGKREGKMIIRGYGPDYVIKCCEYGLNHSWRHFFVGGADGVADRLADNLQQQFPGIQIAGTFCPPFREMSEIELDAMITAINQTKPDIVWVGLGAGKQDKWIAKYKDRIAATWFCGVGAAFDFLSGNTKRASIFWRKLGLEWLYRFAHEPNRLFIRNLEGALLLAKLYWRSFNRKGNSLPKETQEVKEISTESLRGEKNA